MPTITKSLGAIYEDGVLRLDEPVELERRARVRVRIEIPDAPEERTSQTVVDLRGRRLAPDKVALFTRIQALRERTPPVDFSLTDALREIREND
jgi:predicted DNA-binding antitoxin AbrB/MazE fold protein